MDYDLELEKTIKKIKEAKAKLVCIQLADGLKPESKTIKQEIEKNTKANHATIAPRVPVQTVTNKQANTKIPDNNLNFLNDNDVTVAAVVARKQRYPKCLI